MQFLNFQDMYRAIQVNRRKLPKSIDLIVGIPRSGLLPATMLSTQLNLPLTDVEGLKAGKVFGHGVTKTTPDIDKALSSDRNVLVIDDCVGSGRAFREARKALEGLCGNIYYCAVFSLLDPHPDVDFVLESRDSLYLHPWNFMHSEVLEHACVDMDGVLCRNPEKHEDDDGEAYRKFLREAEQLYATSGRIGKIVTGRLEKYRCETEAWLDQHGVIYGKLVMAESVQDHNNSPAYKARVYQESKADLFIESDAVDAAEIFDLSQKPVLCIETQTMASRSSEADIFRKIVGPKSPDSVMLAKLKLRLRSFLGDSVYYAIKGFAGRG